MLLALTAAIRAKKYRGSIIESFQDTHALIAKTVLAFGATQCREDVMVIQAGERTIIKNNGRGKIRFGNLGNANIGHRHFEKHFHIPQISKHGPAEAPLF